MCEKMEELVIESQPADKENAFGPQVEINAQRAAEERKRQAAKAEEMRAKERADEARKRQAAWEEEQRVKKLAEKRAKRILFGIMFGLALILIGGVAMNYIEDFSFPVAVAFSIVGVAAYTFALGWIVGHNARRY